MKKGEKAEMSLEELRALKEPFLDSKGYEKGKSTRANCSSYINKLFDFMNERGYSELNATVISEYLKKYEGTAQLGVRKLRVEEFLDFVKGAKEMNSFDETKQSEEAESATTTEANEELQSESEPVQPVSDIAYKKESESEQVEAPKTIGRPKKAEEDRKANSFSVYLNTTNAEALKDLAAYGKQEVSVLIAEIIEAFISRNGEALSDYRTFYKNRKPLQK
jgi:hypothetical protein